MNRRRDLLLSGGDSAFTLEGAGPLKVFLRSDVGITLNGDKVANWANQAATGSKYDLSQGTAGSQPQVVTNPHSGKAEIFFDGTNDFLEFTGAGLDLLKNKAGMTIFLAYLPVTPTANLRTIFHATGSSEWTIRLSYNLNNSPSTQRYFYDTDPVYSDASENSVDVNQYLIETIRTNPTQNKLTFRSNGVTRKNEATLGSHSGGAYPNSNSAKILVGAYDFGGTLQYHASMYLSAIVVYDDVLPVATCKQVENYLNSLMYGDAAITYINFVGDSNQFGLGIANSGNTVPSKTKAILDAIGTAGTVVANNLGVSGQLMTETLNYHETVDINGIAHKLSEKIYPFLKKKIIDLQSCTNDVGATTPNATIEAAISAFSTFYRGYSYKLILGTTYPCKNLTGTIVSLRNDQVANYAAWGFDQLVDSHAILQTPGGGDDTAGGDFQADGVHLTAVSAHKRAEVGANAVLSILGLSAYDKTALSHPLALELNALWPGSINATLPLNNTLVDTWTSRVNSHQFVAAGGARPTYKTGVNNEMPMIEGDGTSDYMQGGASLLTLIKNKPAFTMIAAVEWVSYNAGANMQAFMISANTDANVSLFSSGFPAGSSPLARRTVVRRVGSDTADVVLTTPTYAPALAIVTYIVAPVNRTLKIRVNGTEVYNGSLTNITEGSFENLNHSAVFLFGGNAAFYANARIGIKEFYDGALTTAEIQVRERIGGLAYGVTVA